MDNLDSLVSMPTTLISGTLSKLTGINIPDKNPEQVAEYMRQIENLKGKFAGLKPKIDEIKAHSQTITARAQQLSSTVPANLIAAEQEKLVGKLQEYVNAIRGQGEIIKSLSEQLQGQISENKSKITEYVQSGKVDPNVIQGINNALNVAQKSVETSQTIAGTDAGTGGTGNEEIIKILAIGIAAIIVISLISYGIYKFTKDEE